MHRDHYLGNYPSISGHVVHDFVDWLAANLHHPTLFAHQYTDRRRKVTLTFSSLDDACARYHWPQQGALGTCLASSDVTLKALGSALTSSLKKASDPEALEAAKGIMKWGGVSAGNVQWLTLNSEGLAQRLEATAAAFTTNNLADPVLLDTQLRFNAGMTKVYSLLVKNFIIYDSRVAAALGWIVVKYCNDRELSKVPAELAFPWAPAKEAHNAKWPKNRNPAQGTLQFPRLSSAVQHAQWNLKASWILAEVLAKAKPAMLTLPRSIAPLRRLEAALFMIGYDLALNGNTVAHMTTTVTPAVNAPADMTECFTVANRRRFYYAIDIKGVRLAPRRRHSIEQINSLLSKLWNEFGDAPFPLANSATKVRTGEERSGIGTAYFSITDGKGNPPDTSALAAVLNEIGALLYTTGGKNNWSINTRELTVTPDGLSLDITALIEREIELSDLL